ncbi:MAG: hypothetical protein ACI392_00355 [Paludibacteraceae bacterium]
MMKKLFALILSQFVFLSFCVSQNTLGNADDAARIAISAYVDSDLGFNREVSKQLLNKMNSILTKQGLAGSKNQRFIITANADVISEDIVVTTKEMYQYQLEVHFIIGDGIEGTKFAMTSQIVKGLGETKADAYLQAIHKVKPSDPTFQKMVNEAKAKIIEYYNSKCDFIMSEAKTLAQKQEYDAAIYKLMSVPDVCKDCYDKCMTAVVPIYQSKIDEEGARLLAEARAIWATGQNAEKGEEAAIVLAKINPSSKSYAEAMGLSNEIAKRIKELDQREWDFALKQQQDEIDLQKSNIKAMRDIGVAFGENQQPITYNISTWW